ncbi:MAG TPA: nucleoside diphosphate kinase regulator, partial [Devosia sp.]
MTTISIADFDLSPDIVLGRQDHQQLLVLAMAGLGHSAEDADGLLYELERAKVMPDAAVPPDVVRMGSRVRFRTNGGDEREVELVFPKHADIGAGKVSVLTPIGTALIGLRGGQSITWMTRDGRKQVLTVLSVRPPEGDDPG